MRRTANFISICILIILLSAISATAQHPSGNRDRSSMRQRMGGTVEGFVINSASRKPVEYATVTLFSLRDSSQVTGGVTNTSGYFKIERVRPGRFFVQVSFVGYLVNTIDSVAIGRESRQVDLGEILLVPTAIELGEVTVSGERPAIEYKIDKKIINVSEIPTAASGTAVDVLENVPSVEVDIDGNVRLRGSGNFTVLIDGRPSILESNEALQQLPASTIESIELITNPSAKYEPDGNSGIINVIMKKDRPQGTSGISNLNLGTYENYGGDILLNQRFGKVNVVLGGNLGKRGHPGTTESESWTLVEDVKSLTHSTGDNERLHDSYGLRGAADMKISSNDYVSLGFRYGLRSGEHSSDLDHDSWTEPGGVHEYYTNASSSERSGDYYSINSDFRHSFSDNGHELAVQFIRQHREGDEESTNELVGLDGRVNSGQRSTELGPSTTYRMKLDYTLPLAGDQRFEAGYQSRLGESVDITEWYELDTITSNYDLYPEFSHSVDYTRNIHSLYSLYAGSLGKLGYQGGLRGEYTYRTVELVGEDEQFELDRWDYYPTAHFSMQLNGGQQLMGSYARRLQRTRGWYLEPFDTWSNAYNVRRGNPDLLPEYIDSYEAGYQRRVGGNLLSVEGYYRVTHNKVEHIRSVYEPNVMLTTIENVGTDYSFGAEFMFMLEPTKWWRLNLMGSLFDYRVEGELNGRSFDENSFNWNMRMNNSLQVTTTTRLQLDGSYRSSSASSQGEREGVFMANVALRKDFFERVLTATLQVRDLLGTANRESTSQGVDFYSHSLRERKSPMVSFSLRFNFNNYKEERSRDSERSRDEGMDDNDDF